MHDQPKVVESRIRQELAEFEKFYNRLVSCRVDVYAPEHERRGIVCKGPIDFGLAPADEAVWTTLRGSCSAKERSTWR